MVGNTFLALQWRQKTQEGKDGHWARKKFYLFPVLKKYNKQREKRVNDQHQKMSSKLWSQVIKQTLSFRRTADLMFTKILGFSCCSPVAAMMRAIKASDVPSIVSAILAELVAVSPESLSTSTFHNKVFYS